MNEWINKMKVCNQSVGDTLCFIYIYMWCPCTREDLIFFSISFSAGVRSGRKIKKKT